MAVTQDSVSGVCRMAGVGTGANATATHVVSASATAIVLHLEIGIQADLDSKITAITATLGGKSFTVAPGSRVHSGTTTDTFGFVESYYMTPTSLGSALPSGSSTLSITVTFTGGSNFLYMAAWSESLLGTDGATPTVITDATNGQLVSSRTLTAALATGGYMTGICGNGTAVPTMTTGTQDASSAGVGGTGNDEVSLAHNSGNTTTSIVWACNNTDYSCATGFYFAAGGGGGGGGGGTSQGFIYLPPPVGPTSGPTASQFWLQSFGPDTGPVLPPAPTPSPPATPAWPTTISNRRIYDQYGNPYPIKCNASWGMSQNLSDTDIDYFLTQISNAGFNCFTIIPCGYSTGTSNVGVSWDRYHDYAGNNFFSGTPFQSSLSTGWLRMDRIMSTAASLGLTAMFSVTYTGFDSGSWVQGCKTELAAAYTASPTNTFNYGAAVATRYLAYDNIIWHIGADNNYNSASTIGLAVDSVFQGIYSVEGASKRIITAEPDSTGGSNSAYSQFFSDAGYTNINTATKKLNSMYKYSGNSADLVDQSYTETGATTYATWDCEPPYRYMGNFGDAPGSDAEGQEMRERLYSVFFRGGIGGNVGNEHVWGCGKDTVSGHDTTNWQGGLAEIDVTTWIPNVWNFIGRVRWDLCTPDAAALLTSGEGTLDTRAACGRYRDLGLIYLPDSRAITLDLTVFSAFHKNMRIRKYDPISAAWSTIGIYPTTTSSQSVSALGNNSSGTTADWVLLIEPYDDSTAPPTPSPISFGPGYSTFWVHQNGSDPIIVSNDFAAIVMMAMGFAQYGTASPDRVALPTVSGFISPIDVVSHDAVALPTIAGFPSATDTSTHDVPSGPTVSVFADPTDVASHDVVTTPTVSVFADPTGTASHDVVSVPNIAVFAGLTDTASHDASTTPSVGVFGSLTDVMTSALVTTPFIAGGTSGSASVTVIIPVAVLESAAVAATAIMTGSNDVAETSTLGFAAAPSVVSSADRVALPSIQGAEAVQTVMTAAHIALPQLSAAAAASAAILGSSDVAETSTLSFAAASSAVSTITRDVAPQIAAALASSAIMTRANTMLATMGVGTSANAVAALAIPVSATLRSGESLSAVILISRPNSATLSGGSKVTVIVGGSISHVLAWTGATFSQGTVKVWTGSSWSLPSVKLWNGSSWVVR